MIAKKHKKESVTEEPNYRHINFNDHMCNFFQ